MPIKQKNSKMNLKKSKSNKRKTPVRRRRQKGGDPVLPMKYFDHNHQAYYYNPEQMSKLGYSDNAVSHGVYQGVPHQVGSNHIPNVGLNPQTGGAPLPAEYFGGNSGRYFAEGSPELDTCTSAYGMVHPTSHGVVLGGENSNWMGPNLAPYPNYQDMTGGSRKRRRPRKTKKTKKNKKKKSKNQKKGRKSRK